MERRNTVVLATEFSKQVGQESEENIDMHWNSSEHYLSTKANSIGCQPSFLIVK